MQWIKEHKALLGTLAAFTAGGLTAIGQREAAAAVGLLATYLLGAGLHASDRDERAK